MILLPALLVLGNVTYTLLPAGGFLRPGHVYIPNVLDKTFDEFTPNVALVHPAEVLVYGDTHTYAVSTTNYLAIPRAPLHAETPTLRCTVRALYTPAMRSYLQTEAYVHEYIHAAIANANQHMYTDHPIVRLLTIITIEASLLHATEVEASMAALVPEHSADVCVTVLFSILPMANSVLGAAYPGTGCAPPHNVMIVTGANALVAGLVLHHEAGHLFNAPHPEPECATQFPNHIMTPYISTSTIRRFEACSLADIEGWIAAQEPAAHCWVLSTTTPHRPRPPLVWPYIVGGIGAGGIFCLFFIFAM